jgi:hypothetical protein
LRAAGVSVGVCVTPTLPIADVEGFANLLAEFRPDVLVCQDFHDAGGGFGADTGDAALAIRKELQWTAAKYRKFVDRVRRDQHVYEGEAGFFPPPQVESAAAPGLFDGVA